MVGFCGGDFPDEAGVVGEAADDGGGVFGVVGEAHQRERGFDGLLGGLDCVGVGGGVGGGGGGCGGDGLRQFKVEISMR